MDGLALSLLDEVSNIGSVRSLDKTIILEINYTTGTGLPFNRRRTTCECVYLEVIGAKNGICDRSYIPFLSCDLDPITLTYELDLHLLNMCLLHVKITFPGRGFRKFDHKQNRHTHADTTERINTPHSRMLIMPLITNGEL